MASLQFEKLQLISTLAKAARTEEFHERQTMVLGDNSTGKSCLVKSLYWTLGAEPARFHGTWTALKVAGLLTFTLDGVGYQMLRASDRFGLFDSRGKLISVMDSVTEELAPRLGKMLDFELRLTTQQSTSRLATPAFCFMPFYVDQDEGWKQPWSSFDRVAQFKSWKQDTVDYHSGVKPRTYYVLAARKVTIEAEIGKLRAERDALERAFRRVKQAQKNIPPPIDRMKFQQEIGRLVDEVSVLQRQRLEITQKLSGIESTRALLEQQLLVAEAALKELDRDYEYASDVAEDPVQCPTCGTEHANSFVNRFGLVDDQQQCRHFVQTLRSELESARSKSASYLRDLKERDFRVTRIESILQTRRGKWRFQDMIEAEGQRRAFELIAQELQTANGKLAALGGQLAAIKSELKNFTDPERKKQIDAFFASRMQHYLARLNVHTLPPDDAKKIKLVLHNTGSDQPRTVLAYYLSIGETMRKYGSTPNCPIVYDTPNQQDQDADNSRRIVECIVGSQPQGTQLILAAVSLHGARHAGREITLRTKQQLLQSQQYERVSRTFAPLLDQMAHPFG